MVSCKGNTSGLSSVTEAITFLVKLGEEILCLSLFRLHIPQGEMFFLLQTLWSFVHRKTNTAQRGPTSKSKLLAEVTWG